MSRHTDHSGGRLDSSGYDAERTSEYDADRGEYDTERTGEYDEERTGEHDADRGADYHETYGEDRRREKFGGTNWGSAFFGWLVAVAVAVLLTSIVGAIVAGVGSNAEVTQSDAEQEAGTIGIVAAVVLLVVLMLAYYAGGYVAGRMSRFDGGKQGLGVWLIGLLVTLLAVGLGILFGSEYNILDRVELPTIPVPTDTLTWGGAIAAAVVLIGTLLSAMAGGKVGRHYHTRVDAAGVP